MTNTCDEVNELRGLAVATMRRTFAFPEYIKRQQKVPAVRFRNSWYKRLCRLNVLKIAPSF